MSRAQPEGTEEVAALADVGQLVGHDFSQERTDALAGLRLVVEDVVQDAVEMLVHAQPH